MNVFPISQFGYPLAADYNIQTDLALLRTPVQSGWSRQRRTYLHNASLVRLTWRLRAREAKLLNDWIQGLPDGEFFLCDILSGNDLSAGCVVSQVELRRTSVVATTRVPLTDQFTLAFDAETREQTGYQTYAAEAADMPPTTYPADLPLPLAEGFTTEQGVRNVATYSLTYRMDTATLARWLEFAGFAGTGWFSHPMVSVNVTCGEELIRYVSAPAQTLIRPNVWDVSVAAECMPGFSLLELSLPTGPCTYDGGLEYDNPGPGVDYDCTGGAPVPPQGNFTMPAGPVAVSRSETGPSPLTATALVKFMRDGTIQSTPGSIPPWPTWHTAALTLPAPAISFDQVVEVSLNDGLTWVFSTPLPGGTWLALKDQDVWVRLQRTSTYDVSQSLPLGVAFEGDLIPTPAAAVATLTLSVNLNVTDPTGVVDGASWFDGYIIEYDPFEPPVSISAGVSFMTDGRVFAQTTNEMLGLWFDPQTINAGQGLWIILTGTGNGSTKPPTGVRLSMAVPNYFTTSKYNAGGGGVGLFVNWTGTYEIWNAQVGGTRLGGGSIQLQSEASQ